MLQMCRKIALHCTIYAKNFVEKLEKVLRSMLGNLLGKKFLNTLHTLLPGPILFHPGEFCAPLLQV